MNAEMQRNDSFGLARGCFFAAGWADSFAQRELLREALEKLSEDQRLVIELRTIKGYSVKETAKIMNRKEGVVRVLQYRAIQSLAAEFNEQH